LRQRPWIVAVVVVATPIAVLLGRVLRSRFLPASDLALIELRVRDVGGRYTPLVGAFSRYHWNHPGPLLFFLLAAPYRLFGSSGSALLAAGTLLNLVAALGCVWLFWRRGGTAGMALGGLVLLVLLRALAGQVLAVPWNPFAIVLPFLLLTLVAWSIACGDDWLLVVAVGLATFCVQSHVGSILVAGTLVAFAVAAFALHVWRGVASSPLRTAIISVLVGFVLWIPPIVDQFKPRGGNLSALWRFWIGPHAPVTGWARGARIVNAQFAIPAPWMSGHEATSPFTGGLAPPWHVPWTLMLLIAAGVIAQRRRDWSSLSLVAIVILTTGAAWASASQVVDEPYGYLLRWTWTLGAIAWFAIGWTTLRVVTDRTVTGASRQVAAAAALAGIALAAATTIAGLHADLPDHKTERALRELDPALFATARRARTPILVTSAPDLASASLADGVLLQLNRRGVDARADDTNDRYRLDEHHTMPRGEARSTIVAAANAAIDQYDGKAAYRRIASYDTLTTGQRAFLASVAEEVGNDLSPAKELRAFRSWAGQHPVTYRQFAQLSARADREALFLIVDNR
jgi:hypothetical protein